MLRMIPAAIVAATLAVSLPARAEQFVNVLTGGTSGVYYPLGVALSNIYGKIPDVKACLLYTSRRG